MTVRVQADHRRTAGPRSTTSATVPCAGCGPVSIRASTDAIGRAGSRVHLLEVGLPLLRRARYRPEPLGLRRASRSPGSRPSSAGRSASRPCGPVHRAGSGDRSAAVGPLADHAVESWRRTGWRTFHWEPWFAGLGAGGRSVVLAEAVTWATPLWATFDWSERSGAWSIWAVADDRWACPGTSVRLKGRCRGPRPAGDGRAARRSCRWRRAVPVTAGVRSSPSSPWSAQWSPSGPAGGVPGGRAVARRRFPAGVDGRRGGLDGRRRRVVDAVAMAADVRGAGPVPAIA